MEELQQITKTRGADKSKNKVKNGGRRLGGAQLGNRFVSFVRTYARSGCLVELDLKSCGLDFSLFPLVRA